MSIPRDGHTLTLLPNGQVLAAGGYTQSNSQVNPKISPPAPNCSRHTPIIARVPLNVGQVESRGP
jgi:hypothetical protein